MRVVGAGLSDRLRSATQAEHERAEEAPFVVALMSGRLDRDGYARLVGQIWHVYSELERTAGGWRGHPVAGPFVIDELHRTAALEADLRWLYGPKWTDRVTPLAATERYVERLRTICTTSTSAFVAHHYTRYLGDLSGGQIIRRRLADLYGLTADGVTFYVFDGIGKVKPFKDGYRRLLNEAAWSPAEHDELVAEANEAFRLNRAVFENLAEAVGLADRPTSLDITPRTDA